MFVSVNSLNTASGLSHSGLEIVVNGTIHEEIPLPVPRRPPLKKGENALKVNLLFSAMNLKESISHLPLYERGTKGDLKPFCHLLIVNSFYFLSV